MPSFMADSAQTIADFIIPVTVTDAVTMTDICVKREINGKPGSGRSYFAVYGIDGEGKPGKWALYINPEYFNGSWHYYVILEEYHPRKNGKAEREFGKEIVVKYGVETIDRHSGAGITYTITDRTHHVIARVEETNGIYNVRDVYDEPAPVGGVKYMIAVRAVDEYKQWAAKH